MIVSTPFEVPYPVKTETAEQAYLSVLAGAGAFPRDTVDRRIVNEVRTGTATGKGTTEKYLNSDGTTYSTNPYYNQVKWIIDNPLAVGGYPEYKTYNVVSDADQDGMDDAWELAKGLDPTNPEDRNTVTQSGYTALEVYLNSLVGEDIPLALSETGFRQTAVFRNPGTDLLQISGPEVYQHFVLLDIAGRPIMKGFQSRLEAIDVSGLQSGLYVLVLKTENGKRIPIKLFI
jgi:pectate lyase